MTVTEHDPLCRCKHMDVATDIDDVGGCDCPRRPMADRERAKEALLKAVGDSYLGPPCPHAPIWHINLDAMLDAILLAVDPIIRADERSKVWRPDAHQMMLERDATRARVTELADELINLRDEVAVLQDALEDVVNQACSESGTDLDSMALSAYAHGMRVLAERGRTTIEREVGRRVIGHWVEVERDAGAAALYEREGVIDHGERR